MKNKAAILLSILSASAVSGLAGCADPIEPQAMREEPVYVTGSNIARKDKVHSGEVSIMSSDAYERAREAINPPIPKVPGGGH